MVVKDLISVWLHSKNPKTEVLIWSVKEVDYIFSTVNSFNYDISPQEVDEMKVRCFTQYYNDKKDLETLVINVE